MSYLGSVPDRPPLFLVPGSADLSQVRGMSGAIKDLEILDTISYLIGDRIKDPALIKSNHDHAKEIMTDTYHVEPNLCQAVLNACYRRFRKPDTEERYGEA